MLPGVLPPPTRRPLPLRSGLGALLVLLALMLLPRSSLAAAPEERPIIKPGREAEILALFQPHEMGAQLAPGWTLHSFKVDMGTIRVFVTDADEEAAQLTLDHPNFGPEGAQALEGFALQIVAQPPGSEVAVEALVAAIEANDDGSFWAEETTVYAEEPREHPLGIGSTQLRSVSLWARDGLVVFGFLAILLLALTLAKLRSAPRWSWWCLAGITLGAGLLRVFLSPEVALAPWPYTRLLMSGGRIFSGPLLALLHPERVWLSETILDSTLAYAMLAPLAVYVHARYLLDEQRAALLCALIVALLPLHLRFSHSDAAFIPSITVSSTCFVLVHAATRERRMLPGILALLPLGPLLAVMFAVRPLNIMYYPLLVATAFVNQGLYTDKPALARGRALVAFLLITAVTFGVGVPRLLENFGGQVSEGLDMSTLISAAQVLFNPRMNALLNPVFTPPGLLALALYGSWELWRRGRRPLLYFLLAWLLGFLAAHAYVVPISPWMQARYHLHLVVPFMLLAAAGAEAALRWLAEGDERDCPRLLAWTRGRETLIARAGLVYLLASPLIHLHGVRNIELNDTREWAFVHTLRDAIPPGCTVLEYTGRGTDMRMRRVGTYTERGMEQQLWNVVEIPMGQDGEDNELPEDIRELLREPPECIYWYEGLPCAGNKPIELRKAPACDAIEGWITLEEVAATDFDSVPYDGNLSMDLGERDHIELRLFEGSARQDD